MKEIDKKALLNTIATAGTNWVDDSTAEWYRIVKTAAGTDNVLPPIPYGATLDVDYQTSVSEVRQIKTIGMNTDEIVVANRKYGIMINRVFDRYEAEGKRDFPYGYTAPAILTGTAATDRYNLYYALVNRLNSYAGNKVEGHLLYKIPFTAGTDNPGTGATGATGLATKTTSNKVRAGAAGEQETSGVTCNIAGVEITSGTFTGDDAVGYIWVYNFSDTSSWLSTSKTLTFTDDSGATDEVIMVTTASALTTAGIPGQGMVIVDDSGYSSVEEYDREFATEVSLTKGFQTATITDIRIPYYPQGQGSDLAALVPTFNQYRNNVESGEANFVMEGDAPVSTATYTTVTIMINRKADADPLASMTKDNAIVYTLYLNESSTLTNFLSNLASMS